MRDSTEDLLLVSTQQDSALDEGSGMLEYKLIALGVRPPRVLSA